MYIMYYNNRDMEKFESLLGHVADLNADRLKLTANMAEDSQRVKVDYIEKTTTNCIIFLSTYFVLGIDCAC